MSVSEIRTVGGVSVIVVLLRREAPGQRPRHYTLGGVSGFGFRVSGFGFRVSGFGFRVSGFASGERLHYGSGGVTVKPWERALASITPLVVAVYAVPLLGLLLLFLGIVDLAAADRTTNQLIFWALLVIAVVDFPLSFVIGGRLLSAERLQVTVTGPDREAIVTAAAGRVRSSALVTSGMGAAIAVYGVLYASVGGSRDRLVYFLALVVAHAVFTARLFAKARGAVANLGARVGAATQE